MLDYIKQLEPAELAALISAFAAIVSSITAITAVFAGSIIQMRVSERNLRATVRSTNRQKWINDLRDEVKSAMADLMFLKCLIAWGANTEEKAKVSASYFEHTSKVALLINPNEKDHAELLSLIKGASSFLMDQTDKENRLPGEKLKSIEIVAQQILKREWERVKKVE